MVDTAGAPVKVLGVVMRPAVLRRGLELAGVTGIVAGVAFLWWPAALLVGGALAIFLAQGLWKES